MCVWTSVVSSVIRKDIGFEEEKLKQNEVVGVEDRIIMKWKENYNLEQ